MCSKHTWASFKSLWELVVSFCWEFKAFTLLSTANCEANSAAPNPKFHFKNYNFNFPRFKPWRKETLLEWAGGTASSEIIHEQNNSPGEKARVSWYFGSFAKPSHLWWYCTLLNSWSPHSPQVQFGQEGAGGGKTWQTLSRGQGCFHLWWHVVGRNLLIHVSEGGAEGQKFSVTRTSSTYTAR